MKFLLFVFVLSMIGCTKTSIRDAKVYKEELNFFDSASEEVVERGKVVIASKCQCADLAGETGFATADCHELAETILALEARVKYHTDMMRFNGGLTDKRPPKDPPPVSETNTLCK